MDGDKYITIRVKSIVCISVPPILAVLIIGLTKVIYNLELYDWGSPTFWKHVAVIISTVCIVVSVNIILFCISDRWKWALPFTKKLSVIIVSCIISAGFCLARIRTLMSMFLGGWDEMHRLYPKFALHIARNALIACISILVYGLIMKLVNHSKKAA